MTAMKMKKLVPESSPSLQTKCLLATPRIVGFSTVFQQNVASLVLAKILRLGIRRLRSCSAVVTAMGRWGSGSARVFSMDSMSWFAVRASGCFLKSSWTRWLVERFRP